MSFILDALKKSENERQRHNGPSLVDTPMRQPPSERPWWAFGLAGLLLLNLLVFAVVLLRDDAEAPAVAAAPASNAPEPMSAPNPQSSAPVAPPPRTAPTYPAPANDPAVRSLAAEAGVPEEGEEVAPREVPLNPDLVAAAEAPAGRPIVRPIQGPSTAPTRTQQPVGPERDEVLPTLSDLTASGSTQFPAMHLDIHVYSTTPTERFVFINMRKYREGEAMNEGPLVERIDRDGVVMNHRGLRFLLPRQ